MPITSSIYYADRSRRHRQRILVVPCAFHFPSSNGGGVEAIHDWKPMTFHYRKSIIPASYPNKDCVSGNRPIFCENPGEVPNADDKQRS